MPNRPARVAIHLLLLVTCVPKAGPATPAPGLLVLATHRQRGGRIKNLRTIVPLHLASDWTSPFNASLLKKNVRSHLEEKVCKLLLNYNDGPSAAGFQECVLWVFRAGRSVRNIYLPPCVFPVEPSLSVGFPRPRPGKVPLDSHTLGWGSRWQTSLTTSGATIIACTRLYAGVTFRRNRNLSKGGKR